MQISTGRGLIWRRRLNRWPVKEGIEAVLPPRYACRQQPSDRRVRPPRRHQQEYARVYAVLAIVHVEMSRRVVHRNWRRAPLQTASHFVLFVSLKCPFGV